MQIWSYNQADKAKKEVPKLVRKLLARTQIHRAWLQSATGSFQLPVLERI
nr:hypothetical protein [Vibrio alginolyticus]